MSLVGCLNPLVKASRQLKQYYAFIGLGITRNDFVEYEKTHFFLIKIAYYAFVSMPRNGVPKETDIQEPAHMSGGRKPPTHLLLLRLFKCTIEKREQVEKKVHYTLSKAQHSGLGYIQPLYNDKGWSLAAFGRLVRGFLSPPASSHTNHSLES